MNCLPFVIPKGRHQVRINRKGTPISKLISRKLQVRKNIWLLSSHDQSTIFTPNKNYMRKLSILILITIFSSSAVAQAIVDHWMINTTGDLYSGDSTDVKRVYYNNNYVFLTANGIPSYFPAYAGESVFQPVNQSYTYRVKREPQLETGTHETTLKGGMGVAINGVPFYQNGDSKSWDVSSSSFLVSGADIWHSLAWEKEGLDMDGSYGHSTASGNYHHHVADIDLFDNSASSVHSPLIGFAFDGFPIYGPFGYTDALDNTSGISRMTSSWQERTEFDISNGAMDGSRVVLPDGTVLTNASDYGPTIDASNPIGVCREDYEYIDGLGTLDEYNGRWCVTPEYPCGTYAYFVAIDASGDPKFPYICGNEYAGVLDYTNSNQFVNASIPSSASEWDYTSNICNLTVTETLSDPSCAGNDGSISLTVDGFGDSVCYDWSHGASGASISGLSAGTYTVTVSGNSCSSTEMYTLSGSSGASVTVTGSNPTTCGAADGSITFDMPSGTPPYAFSIDSGATFTTTMPPAVFSGLAAGTYYTAMSDGAGCMVWDTIVLTAASGVTYTAIVVDESCGAANGSIELNASGGDGGPYTYSIDAGSTYQSSNSFTGLTAGNYDVSILDGSGCEATGTETVNSSGSSVSYVATITDEACGMVNGSIVFSASGGDGGPYQYSIDNGVTFQGGATFSGLSSATYSVVVEDASGCQATGMEVVGATSAPTITSTVDVDPICSGNADGSIEVIATGGSGALNYSNDNGVTFQTANMFTGLGAGTYNIVVEDSLGCQTTTSVTLTDPIAVAYTAVVSNESCAGGDGSIALTASGGDGGPYTYSIDGGVTYQSSGTFGSLGSGTYSVSILDASGCEGTGTEVISTVGAPSIVSVLTNDPSCHGFNDGFIEILSSGGSGTITYSNDNGASYQSSNLFTSLGAGVYQLSIQDTSGCTDTTTVTLTDPAPVTFTATETPATCGMSNGQLDFVASGGDGGPYLYSIDMGTTTQSSGTFTGLAAGIYPAYVEDASGCIAGGPQPLGSVGGPSITDTLLIHPTCYGDSDGSIDITATGGGTLLYSIDSGATFVTTNVFSSLSADTYNIVVEDGAGCQTFAVWELTDPDSVSFSATVTDESCSLNDGEISLAGSGGDGGPYMYGLDGGTLQSSGTFSGLAGGTYTIEVQDASGCTATGWATVNGANIATIDSVVVINPSCTGDADGTVTIYATGTGLMYVFDGGSPQPGNMYTGVSAGTYNVTVLNGSCPASTTTTLTDPPAISISAVVTDETTPPGNNGAIDLNVTGGTGSYTFDWNNDGTGDFDDSEDLSGLTSNSYMVTVMDANGCTDTASYFVDNVVGLTEEHVQITVYPNPTSGIVNIQLDGVVEKWTIVDVAGNLVAAGINSGQPDLSGFANGLYTLRVITNKGEFSRLIFKE